MSTLFALGYIFLGCIIGFLVTAVFCGDWEDGGQCDDEIKWRSGWSESDSDGPK